MNPGPRGPRGSYAQRTTNISVAPVPVPGTFFTFGRAAAHQCLAGMDYPVYQVCAERDYFNKQVKAAVKAWEQDNFAPKPQVLTRLVDALKLASVDAPPILDLRTIEYGQLKQRPAPAVYHDLNPDIYHNFEVTELSRNNKPVVKKLVHAPSSEGGFFAEVTQKLGLRFKVSLMFNVHIPDFNEDQFGDGPCEIAKDYGLRLEWGQRGDAGVYAGIHKKGQNVIKLTFGEIHPETRGLVAWRAAHQTVDYICLAHETLANELFDQFTWDKLTVEGEQEEGEEEVEEDGDPLDDRAFPGDASALPGDDPATSRGRYTFGTVDDKLCYYTTDKSGKEVEPIHLANFCIPKMLALYQFAEEGEMPLFKVLCRHRLAPPDRDGNDHVVYITAEEGGTTKKHYCGTPGTTLLELEVTFCPMILKTPAEVKKVFGDAHGVLQTTGLTPEMLSYYLVSIEQPLPKLAIMRWGKQANGWSVFHNCAYKDGELTSVEASGHAIVRAYFNNNPNCPMPTSDFPKLIVAPFKHVRYFIMMKMWNDLYPKFFQNNEMPAKAVFALAVLGLHADRCWGGETGIGHGMPVGWVYSPEHGSGKTEAILAAHSMLGLFHRPITAGDTTKSFTFEAASMEANLTKFIDDVVPAKDPNGENSSKWISQAGRAFYDRTARAVTGKIRRPSSSCCFTANCTINMDDKAFQSRMITIPFKPLKCGPDDDDDDPDLYNQFQLFRELLSACQVDLQMIGLYNGKLDKQAIQDTAQYLQKCLATKRDRNVNEWAKQLYIWVLLNVTCQNDSRDMEKTFEWVLKTVTRTNHELTNHAGVFDRFIIALLTAKEDIAPNPLGPNPEKLLNAHNLRTDMVPPLCGGSTRFWAIRVKQACVVLKNLKVATFNHHEVLDAAKDSPYAIVNSKARFYDTRHGWPIKKSIVPLDGVGAMLDVPLDESELLDVQLTEQRCIFIKTQYINEIRNSLEQSAATDIDYKTVMVKSHKRDEGTYNFYEAVTGSAECAWYGFRSVTQSPYRTYCGATNELQIGSATTLCKIVPTVEQKVKEAGFNSPEACFRPEMLLEFFGHKPPTHADLTAFPPCYVTNPFAFRNDPDDEEPDDPLNDMWTEADAESIVGASTHSTPAKAPAPSSRPTRPDTGMSPTPRRKRVSVDASPLSPHNRSAAEDDEDSSPPVKRRRRMRASPTNLARYPRPPEEINSMETARQWVAYALARGLGPRATGGGTSRHRSRNNASFVLTEADDDEDDEADEAEEAALHEETAEVCFSIKIRYNIRFDT